MSKLKSFNLLVLIWLLFISCNDTTKDKAEEFLKSRYAKTIQALQSIDSSLIKSDLVVIIPNEGCGGCISNATSYLTENISDIKAKVAVVFTGIRDKKLFRLQVDKDFLKLESVYIDEDNYFLDSDLSSVYPQMISLKNEEVTSIQTFDTGILATLIN
ncbi:MAG: hypothetical protein AAFQ94_21890 [Bacteroidota bacterium]